MLQAAPVGTEGETGTNAIYFDLTVGTLFSIVARPDDRSDGCHSLVLHRFTQLRLIAKS